MVMSIWASWRAYRQWSRASAEAKQLVGEAKRILKKKRYRIPESVAATMTAAVAEVEAARKEKNLERLRQALTDIDGKMDEHLAFARKSAARQYAESIGLALGVALLLRAFVVEAFQIPSGSMIPTLEVGDHIFVSKFAYAVGIPFTNAKIAELGKPKRGDIIVFKYPPDQSIDYIKRVIGLPAKPCRFATTRSSSTAAPWRASNCASPAWRMMAKISARTLARISTAMTTATAVRCGLSTWRPNRT